MNIQRRITRSTAGVGALAEDHRTTNRQTAIKQASQHQNENAKPVGKNIQTSSLVRRRAALGDLSNKNYRKTQCQSSDMQNGKPRKALAESKNIPPSKVTEAYHDTKIRKGIPKKSVPASANVNTEVDCKEDVQNCLDEDLTKRKRELLQRTQSEIKLDESDAQALKKKKTIFSTSEIDHDDLDAEDVGDPLMVSEYVSDIFNYLREQELDTLPDPSYMDMQPELSWKMRGILSDWLIEVHSKFRLLPETLFLAINILDRFLSKRRVTLNTLQLVGITSLFIASKYEEVLCPSIQNFVYMGDGGYTDEDIISAENAILLALDFNLSYPNPMNFLRRISKADDYDIQVRTVGKYLVEISLLDHRLMSILPSKLCAASMLLAREMLNRGEWNNNLIYYSGYTMEELELPYKLMVSFLESEPVHDAFFRKYASKKFMKASQYVREWVQNDGPKLFQRLRHSDLP